MIEGIDFYSAWPEYVDVQVKINWTVPATHDVLFSGLVAEDETAYFYAIVARHDKEWCTHYIGKVFAQTASLRHRAPDHLARLSELRARHPDCTFHLTLGTPHFLDGRGKPDGPTIDEIEGLLIYSNWWDGMINKQKIESFARRGRSPSKIRDIQGIYASAQRMVFFTERTRARANARRPPGCRQPARSGNPGSGVDRAVVDRAADSLDLRSRS